MTTARTRTTGHSAKVLGYFEARIGQNVYVDKMASDIGLPVRTAKATVHTLRSKFGADVFQPVIAGSVWRFTGLPDTNPEPTDVQKTSGDLTYTQVGITQAGVVIAKDPQNNLYSVAPL